MKRLLPHPVLALVLVLVWALLWDSFAPGVLLLGAGVALVISHWTAGFWLEPVRLHRPRALLRLLPLVLWDIVVANLVVARRVLGRNRTLRPAWLEIPLDVSDPYAQVAFASIITLTPGTVSARFSDDRRTLYVHALDVADPAAEVATIKRRYEAPLMEIFQCSPTR